MRARRLSAAVTAALLIGAPALSAQQPRSPEAQALRDAGAFETKGQLPQAEAILRKLLDSQPTSVGGLFALERVLRAEGRVAEVLTPANRFLATTPDASGVRVMKMKVLAEVDSADAMLRAADEWIKRSPGDPMLYREAFPVMQKAMDPKRSLELIRTARKLANDPVALALEIGDLFVTAGAYDDAASQWARIAANSSERSAEIIKRVSALSDQNGSRTKMAGALMDALVRAPSGVKQRVVAVQVALAFERPELALQMAKAIEPELDDSARPAFLESLATWGANESNVVLWALGEIRDALPAGADKREIDTRITKAAMQAGDTTAAIEAGQRVASRLPKGNAERRKILADEIRMRAKKADVVLLSNQFQAFREEFPEAPELDELAAMVSTELQSGGEGAAADALLSKVNGPESSLERAYLNLADGKLEIGRALLILASPGIAPARATAELQLASLLGRMTPQGQMALAKAAVDAHRGRAREAGKALEDSVATLPEEDRPMALGQAARFYADVGADEDAARVRTALLKDYPDCTDAPEATLGLARWHARTSRGVPTAIELLENLIIKSPEAAVAPDARRELQRLRSM